MKELDRLQAGRVTAQQVSVTLPAVAERLEELYFTSVAGLAELRNEALVDGMNAVVEVVNGFDELKCEAVGHILDRMVALHRTAFEGVLTDQLIWGE